MQEVSLATIVESIIQEDHKKTSHKKKKGAKSRAGRAGKIFESVVLALTGLGFKRLSFKEYQTIPQDKLPNRYIICGVPYEGLMYKKALEYNVKTKLSKTEFVIVAHDAKSTAEFPLLDSVLEIRIECKWQSVSGTAQEKILTTVLNLQCAPENDVILLMDGPGFYDVWHCIVQEWCEHGVTWPGAPESTPKNIQKMRLEEFIGWCNRAFS